MTASFEETAEKLTKDGPGQQLPGVAVMVADDTGTIRYSNSFGSTTNGPVTVDSTMWVASCTKLLTTVAVLQCVERDLIKLDEPVEQVLPELADPGLIYALDEDTGAPLMRKAKKKITMRHLLTHSSGLGYDAAHPMLMAWRKNLGQEFSSLPGKPLDDIDFPLVFEPGEGFTYGISTDRAGQAVERVNGNIRLGEYMQKNIWDPLGMTKTTFNAAENPVVKEAMAGTSARTSTGGLEPAPSPMGDNPPVDDAGGVGMYSCAADYIKVLVSLLRNDGKLLKPETVSEMFQPQLSDPKYINDICSDPDYGHKFTLGLGTGKQWDWGLGGLLAMEETSGRRSKGTMTWCGYSNPMWWISPARKTCGFMATQVVPPFDPQAIHLFGELESMAWGTFGAAAPN